MAEKGAAANKRAAAQRDKKGKNHRLEYVVEGSKSAPLVLELPPRLRASVVGRAGVLRDNDLGGAMRLVQAVLGSEQFDAVMDLWDAENLEVGDTQDSFATEVGNLLGLALDAYGLTPGESEASTTP